VADSVPDDSVPDDSPAQAGLVVDDLPAADLVQRDSAVLTKGDHSALVVARLAAHLPRADFPGDSVPDDFPAGSVAADSVLADSAVQASRSAAHSLRADFPGGSADSPAADCQSDSAGWAGSAEAGSADSRPAPASLSPVCPGVPLSPAAALPGERQHESAAFLFEPRAVPDALPAPAAWPRTAAVEAAESPLLSPDGSSPPAAVRQHDPLCSHALPSRLAASAPLPLSGLSEQMPLAAGSPQQRLSQPAARWRRRPVEQPSPPRERSGSHN
jgi:hypothetical protein